MDCSQACVLLSLKYYVVEKRHFKCTERASQNTYLHMHTVILVNNGKKDADKYVHADNNKNDEKQAGPRIVVISRHPDARN